MPNLPACLSTLVTMGHVGSLSMAIASIEPPSVPFGKGQKTLGVMGLLGVPGEPFHVRGKSSSR